jgi:hypothetical protein
VIRNLLLCLLLAGTAQARSVGSAREARAIAEHETSGIAVSARRVHLNGATGGWEVDLHMPGEKRGWRCVVDSDTHMVFTKTRIPNPDPPRQRKKH